MTTTIRPSSRFPPAARTLVRLVCLLAGCGLALVPMLVQADAVTLEEVLFRANESIIAYERTFNGLLADEQYTQRTLAFDGPVKKTREFKSEYLFFRAATSENWAGFRDVLDVDGKPLERRRDTLEALSRRPLRAFITEVNRLYEEGARHYLGSAPRSVNVPPLTLSFLHPLNQHRFTFEKVGEETIAGVPAWAIRFTEYVRPTLIRAGGGDLFATGTFWLDPESGRVLKSDVTLGDANTNTRIRARITVSYRPDPGLGIWVPGQMDEFYDTPRTPRQDRAEGTAVYTNYRRLDLERPSEGSFSPD